jgi:hypothetical protein
MTKLGTLLVFVTMLVGMVAAWDESQQEFKVRELMRRKLDFSHKVLEGIVVEDFEQIAQNADALGKLSLAAEWQVFPSAEYKRHSGDFRRITEELHQMALDHNLDGAALKYVEMTLSCVNCHKYVRRIKMDETPEPRPMIETGIGIR